MMATRSKPAAKTAEQKTDETVRPATSKAKRRRPEWMVPTDDGMVPESEYRRRKS